ncbi:MAG TPA: DUF2203 domain-containing protein [Roseiflexaceae bacterium]|nr:DUF2203 domain-containing protein [Roseiflexaceae bacterium]
MPRYFTVAEANALLPLLRPHVRRLIDSWRRLNDVQAEVVALLERRPHDDLGGPPLSIAATAIIGAQSAIVAIQAYGAELKDPATGLLDFPAIRNGSEVYLCWRYGEERIGFWHPLDTGIAGRQPLEEQD